MSSLETWVNQVNTLADQVGALEPDPSQDWFAEKQQLQAIVEQVDAKVLSGADEALGEVLDQDHRAELARVTVQLVESAAALRIAAGRQREALTWLEQIEPLARGTAEEDFLAAARRDPEAFMALSRAWWHVKERDLDRAKELAGPIAEREDVFGEHARSVLEIPRPLRSAPTLFTLNGFGVSIYGERGHHADGTFIKTRYLTGLFVPLMPLDAYRVAHAEEAGSFYFIGKVPLGPVAKIWRLLAVLALVLVPTGLWAQSYLDSPQRHFALALQELRVAEQGAKTPAAREALLVRHERVLEKYSTLSIARLQPAAVKAAQLITAAVPEPLVYAELGSAHRAIKRFAALPELARRQKAAQHLVSKVGLWAEQLARSSERPALDAAIGLLERARQLAEGIVPGALAGLQAKRREIDHRMATSLAKQGWKLEAIRRLAALDDAGAARAAGKLLAEIRPASFSVWLELAPVLDGWGRRVGKYGLAEFKEQTAAIQARLKAARARADKASYKKLLAQKDLEALRQALVTDAGDQQLGTALARLLRQEGKAKAARAVLEKLGAPGLLVREAQALYASVLADAGELKRAAELLEIQLGARLPAFEQARRVYGQARERAANALIAQAKLRMPSDLEGQMRGASKDKQPEIFQRWLAKRLSADGQIEALRQRYLGFGDVVPTALTLGTIKLRLAAGAKGEARRQLLSRAERVFLAIQGEAAGAPSYHLGLGQVYYRLGKRDAGAKEFAALLARKDPPLSLAVCRAYRDLGMIKEARQQAERVYGAAGSPQKEQAATLLALMAPDNDEKEKWLRRADPKDPFVRTALLEVQAGRLLRDGNYTGADRKLAEALTYYRRDAKHNASSANNAALALQGRFNCTNKVAYLDEAVKTLEQARRLSPDSALILTNLSGVISQRLVVRVFARFFPISLLKRADVGPATALGWLLPGPRGPKVRQEVRKSADYSRLLEISRQAEILGPSRTSSYGAQSGWLAFVRDVEGLRDLDKRLAQVESLDLADTEALRRKMLSGSQDKEDLSRLRARLTQLKKLEVKAGGDKLVLAAISLLESSARTRLAFLTKDAKEALAAARLQERAMMLEPTFQLGRSRAQALILAAVLTVGEKSPELAKRYDKEGRQLSALEFLYRLHNTDVALAKQVMGQQAWRSALSAARTHLLRAQTRPSTVDLMIARLSADKALLAPARGVLGDEASRLSLQISRRLDPGNRGYELQLGLFAR